MQVNLKQTEIEKALQLYLNYQGIVTAGKEVGYAFTAGRKGTGLSVEITISSTPISPVEPTLMAAHPQSTESQENVIQTATASDNGNVDEGTDQVTDEPKKTVSLFN